MKLGSMKLGICLGFGDKPLVPQKRVSKDQGREHSLRHATIIKIQAQKQVWDSGTRHSNKGRGQISRKKQKLLTKLEPYFARLGTMEP